MTDQEIVQALRCCERADSMLCPFCGDEDCVGNLCKAAADLIESLTAENAALREKQAMEREE